jgi:tRNA threonylcarbamoyladenosine biosynthesis protein TsaE
VTTAYQQKTVSQSPEETIQLGEQLGKALRRGDIICLFGDLGSGKTTFIKGIAAGMEISRSQVHSPTFVLMNIYEGRLPLFHFDFYRLDNIREIGAIGCDEFLYDDGVAVIEWADRLGQDLPEEYLKVELKHKAINERVVIVSPVGRRYKDRKNRYEYSGH